MNLKRAVAWIAFGLALAGAAASLLPAAKPRGFDAEAFGQLPVLEGGRVKPLDSIARNALLVIRGKQSVPFEGRSLGADEWLLDVLFRPEVADRQEIFVIDDPEVLGLIGIQQSKNRYYSFATLAPHIDELQRQYAAADPVEPKLRSRYQSAVVNLFERMFLYHRLKNTLQLEGTPGLAAEIAAREGPGAPQRHQALAQLAYFRPLLPTTPTGDGWRNVGEALARRRRRPEPGLEQWARLGVAYRAQDPASFNRAVADLTGDRRARPPRGGRAAGHEWLFNRGPALLLGHGHLRARAPRRLRVLGVEARAHAAARLRAARRGRARAHARPRLARDPAGPAAGHEPLLLGGVRRLGRGAPRRRSSSACTAAASPPRWPPPAGFASLIVAHHLTGDGDTMEMMRAVLDSNFWLATHVVTITIGYSGDVPRRRARHRLRAPAHIVQPRAIRDATKALVAMTYGIICFALFFSFVGHRAGRHLGRPVLGPVLGLGSEGERRAAHRALERHHPARPLGRATCASAGIMAMAIFGNVITSLLLVRREHARRGAPLLRLHGQGLLGALGLHRARSSSLMAFALAAGPLLERAPGRAARPRRREGRVRGRLRAAGLAVAAARPPWRSALRLRATFLTAGPARPRGVAGLAVLAAAGG